jgi:hypothetical protein
MWPSAGNATRNQHARTRGQQQVDDPVVVGDERHDARVAVLCRVGDDGEAADQPPVD